MADFASYGNTERDTEQELVALKKGTQLLKFGRKGKPKFRTFRLSTDETTLIWFSKGEEKHLKLSTVSRIIPGQRTPVFRRSYRPDKEYLSFSLIYNGGERSLDLICKDQIESEIWLTGLRALISTGQPSSRRTRSEISDSLVSSSITVESYSYKLVGWEVVALRDSYNESSFMSLQLHCNVADFTQDNRLFGAKLEPPSSIFQGRVSTDSSYRDICLKRSSSHVGSEGSSMQTRASGDGFRISVSSSCSSHSSGPDDLESLGDVYVWGEIWSDGTSGGSGVPIPVKIDVTSPKQLEANVVLDVNQISCGVRHIGLVTRHGEIFTWGEESGGRLGHGIEKDLSSPRLVETLAVTSVESVACGEFHTCAFSTSGDLYTWGDGIHNAGLLGHGNDVSYWLPKRVSRSLEGLQVITVACGSWHSAVITSTGQLFTFGDGIFGALGHGDRHSAQNPKAVQALNGLRTMAVSCGIWHTAAIVEVTNRSGAHVSSRKLFTWGDGDKNRLGHGNKNTYLVPTCVSALIDYNVQQIACGNGITVALTTSGHVFTMGTNEHGQLGNPQSNGKLPGLVQDGLVGEFVEHVSCGAYHIAVLTSRSEVFTWGKGANGRLGHGDSEDHHVPKLVEALKDRIVRSIACGSNYTASICTHKWVSGADQSVCTTCRQAFGFTRKRHNCYNCGLVHCHGCSSKKALRAALAPTSGKPHRVCDSCYQKLKRPAEASNAATLTRKTLGPCRSIDRGHGRTSRVLLSPTNKPVKYLEPQPISQLNSRSTSPYSRRPSPPRSPPVFARGAFDTLKRANDLLNQEVSKMHAEPHGQTQPNLRPTFPYSRRPSPPRSPPTLSRGTTDILKRTNDLLSQEVSKMNGEVKSLKQKTEEQDFEIHKLKEVVQESSSLSADRSAKCNRVVQAFKTITDQLNEIKDKFSPEILECEAFNTINALVEPFMDNNQAQAPIGCLVMPHGPTNQQHNHVVVTGGPNSLEDDQRTKDHADPGVHVTPKNADGMANGNNASSPCHRKSDSLSSIEGGMGTPEPLNTDKEVIEQFEPGVYVTLLQLSSGTKLYKRVRFSKRRFSEQQAEEWWIKNNARLLMKYSPPKITNKPAEATIVLPLGD